MLHSPLGWCSAAPVIGADLATATLNESNLPGCDLGLVGGGALEVQSGLWREVVCGRAFTAAHPTGCAVRAICALMFSQQGVASGGGAAQVVGEHVGV